MKLEIEPSIHTRTIRAFLDLIILLTISNKTMTGYEVTTQLSKKFGIIVGPGVVYSKIYFLERESLIECVRKKKGRTYKLTRQGEDIVKNIPYISKEIQSSLRLLLLTK